MKTLLFLLGLAGLAMGLLWIGQGVGWIAWPQESFMINQMEWSWYGAALAFVGLVMIAWSRR